MAKAGLILRLDEEIDLVIGIRLVIVLFRCWLITLGRWIRLLALLGVTVVGAGLAQLMLLADLGHFRLMSSLLGAAGARGRMGNNRS